MYEIYVQESFSAAHSLRGYRGRCKQKHGHNWMVKVYVQCSKLDSLGIGVDFIEVRDKLRRIIKNLDHKDLNEVIPFDIKNPSSENIAEYIYQELKEKLDRTVARLAKVRVSENQSCGVTYWEE